MTVAELMELAADCTPQQWQAVCDFATAIETTTRASERNAHDANVARITELEAALRECATVIERETFLKRHPAAKRARALLAEVPA